MPNTSSPLPLEELNTLKQAVSGWLPPELTIEKHAFSYKDTATAFHALSVEFCNKALRGNKALKLLPSILGRLENRISPPRFATFGGSTSNHLRAVAAAAPLLNLDIVVFLRESPKGYHLPLLNMLLESRIDVELLSPADFKSRESASFIKSLKGKFGQFELIPEGGNTPSAVKHIANVIAPLSHQYDSIYLPVGLGTTLAGVSCAFSNTSDVYGISSVKADPSLSRRVQTSISHANLEDKGNWSISYDYHFGGYGKSSAELEEFSQEFESQTGIVLCRTYTAKSAYAMWDHARQGKTSAVPPLWFNTYNPA